MNYLDGIIDIYYLYSLEHAFKLDLLTRLIFILLLKFSKVCLHVEIYSLMHRTLKSMLTDTVQRS